MFRQFKRLSRKAKVIIINRNDDKDYALMNQVFISSQTDEGIELTMKFDASSYQDEDDDETILEEKMFCNIDQLIEMVNEACEIYGTIIGPIIPETTELYYALTGKFEDVINILEKSKNHDMELLDNIGFGFVEIV